MKAPYSERSFWEDVFVRERGMRQFLTRMLFRSLAFPAIAALVLFADSRTSFTIDLGVTPFEVGGVAIGLLLVLRTNVGSARWWEARQVWGGIVNQSRSLATAAISFGPADPAWRDSVIRLTIAFAHATRRRLRGEEMPELGPLLGAAAARRITEAQHPALMAAGMIGDCIQMALARGEIDGRIAAQIERERMTLINHLGALERILTTPMPRGYSVLLRQSIVAFTVAIPFGLAQKSGWLTPLITLFVAFPMLALDEIGAELQNPFSTDNLNHLPLDAICATIEANLLALLAAQA